MEKYGTYNKKTYESRNGSPFDRGSADHYYGREYSPHYYIGGTGDREVCRDQMTAEELEAYDAGYKWNEKYGDQKDWG